MRVFSKKTLRQFWERREFRNSEQALKSWHDEAIRAHWKTPHDVKSVYGNASILRGNKVVFNIHGNAYRLVVEINYAFSICYVLFVGTHYDYDKLDIETL